MSNPTKAGSSPSRARSYNPCINKVESLEEPEHRNEERAFMRGRVWQIDEPNDFSKIFFPPEVHAALAHSNIFKDPPTFKSEPMMHDWIVSISVPF